MDWVLQREVCWDFRILTQAIYELPYRLFTSYLTWSDWAWCRSWVRQSLDHGSHEFGGLVAARNRGDGGGVLSKLHERIWPDLTGHLLVVVVWCDGSDGLLSLYSLSGCKGFGDLNVGSRLEVFGWLQNLGFFNGKHNCMTTFLYQVEKWQRQPKQN